MPKLLTEDQVAQFKRDGYASPFRVVPSDHAREFHRRIEAFEQKLGRDSEGYFKIKAHIAAPWMTDLARSPVVLDAVEDVIGPDILLLGSSLFAKQANDTRFVSWHQDATYFGITPAVEVTVWIAFTESNETNGCVKVLPGSHLQEMAHEERMHADNMLARGQTIAGVDESKAVNLILEPGQFSLHAERTAHASAPNGSGQRRIGLACFYIPPHVASVKERRTALLVRGTDTHAHWDRDPLPSYDLDPACMAELDRIWGKYRNGQYRAH